MQYFYWERQPEAEKACLDLLDDCKRKNSTIARFEEKLLRQTSSRLFDRLDHFYLPGTKSIREKLGNLGFIRQPNVSREAYFHRAALLPTIVLSGHHSETLAGIQGIALQVENISDFLHVNGFRAEIEGAPLSPFRRALVAGEGGVNLMVVERRGIQGYEPAYPPDFHQLAYLGAIETWQNRPRTMDSDDRAFAETFRIADNVIEQVGVDLAAEIVCQCERNYWLSRNYAARVQQSRQDTLGLGWTNHDHYTFRSSRHNFSSLVELFSMLGFRNRERFYAGDEAGWGAQLMENPAGLTLFLDVDLLPEEVQTDFSLEQLKPLDKLGTVGLWCALHGDSILTAGMHHMAARYDFERLIKDIARHNIEYMAPFSSFSYLKQAFSVAEKWEVDPARINALLKDKLITIEQQEKFLAKGAVGSHLENIERREGYKGFNQKNVSAIIQATDPRRYAA